MIGEAFGNYRVTAKLGEGGMGAVYLAEHTALGRRAAVKVLLPEHCKRQDLLDRFFVEAKTAANLRHPALVEVFDYGVRPDGSAYLVMDCLDGESLGARLARVHRLSAHDAVDVARQIAGGVGAAHGKGIVHRDLKPDNVFLVPDPEGGPRERVKILDFGIAKLLGPPGGSKGATSTGMVLGTPLFMAPEQCRGAGTVDHRADIYSLGCILYMMLCGQPPFPYEGVGEILGAHLHEPVRPPRQIDATIPAALDAMVCRALAKDPAQRFQTMVELAAALAPMGPPSLALAGGVATAATGAAAAAGAGATGVAVVATTLGAAAGEQNRETELVRRPARRWWPWAAVIAGVVCVAGAVVALVSPSRTPALPAGPTLAQVPVVTTAREPARVAAPALVHAPVPAREPTLAPVAAPSPAAKSRPHVSAAQRGSNGLYDQAIALRARGQELEALAAFRGYLKGGNLPPADRADAERQAIGLARKFGEIEVLCDVSGADVRVDGRSQGRTPLVRSIFLPPGPHQLTLTKTGYRAVQKSFTIAAGQRQPFQFRIGDSP